MVIAELKDGEGLLQLNCGIFRDLRSSVIFTVVFIVALYQGSEHILIILQIVKASPYENNCTL